MRGRLLLSHAGLTLARPYLLLTAASLVSWPWRALEVPGTIGNVSPPALLLLVVVLYGGIRAMAQHLPLRLITHPPAALGAVVFLTVGFATDTLDPESTDTILLGYAIVLLFVVLISVAMAINGLRFAVAFTLLFITTQALQIPVFEEDAVESLSWPTLATSAAAARAVVETAAIIWLAHRLVMRPETSQTRTVLAMVALMLVHGWLVAWQQPLGNGELTLSLYASGAGSWMLFVGIQVGVVTVVARLRREWGTSMAEEKAEAAARSAAATAPPAPAEAAIEPSEAVATPSPPGRKGGRPTPRSRRRKR